MSLQLNDAALVYEERVTSPLTLPCRITQLELELVNGPPWVGRAPDAHVESLAVAIEVKRDGEEFVEVARLGPFSEPGLHRIDMPRADEVEETGAFITSGKRRSVFRCRLIHVGRLEPRYRLRVIGL